MADLPDASGRRRLTGLALGLVAFLGVLAAPSFTPQAEAQRVGAVALLMAIWWITEAAPLSVTALLPLMLFPFLGVADIEAVAAPYADPVIFLFLGGFILGAAIERCGLHNRVGLACATAMGTTPQRLLAGVMTATAVISMWVSNTATAAMMMPVAAAIVAIVERQAHSLDAPSRRNLGVSILLGVAYAASIGGLATLVGSPPNALLAGYMAREHGVEVGFVQWFLVAAPLSAVLLVVAWLVLARLYPVHLSSPGVREALVEERSRIGRMSTAEWRVAAVFVATALAWVLRPLIGDWLPGLSDAGVAVTAALSLFLLPSGVRRGARLAEIGDLKAAPWDVLLLFGGGLSLAAAISSSGLAVYLASLLQGAQALPLPMVVLLLTALVILVSELASNTASAATLLPIGGALALAMGADPLVLALPLAMGATCAFMLPVGTPPNALVYGSGRIAVGDMVRAGVWLNLSAVALITLAALVVAPMVFR